MFSDKAFQIALIISICTHGVILSQNPNFSVSSSPRIKQNPEVKYIKPPKQEKTLPKVAMPQKGYISKTSLQAGSHKISLPNSINIKTIQMQNQNQKNIANIREPIAIKPSITKPDIIAVKKKITLPPVDLDKIDNPSYVSYYQIVREKIRRCAYQYYTRTEQGEVYLSFVISNDGYVREIRVVEEKSSSNPYLLEISVKSIKEAAPFPNFPKELDYQQLSFNVVISYEIGE
ncbi:MAG: TonB family protein [Candidatus Omnitrophica bacterium]|nr:TonB family protein [Candidatus Omnitrophota bacterium]